MRGAFIEGNFLALSNHCPNCALVLPQEREVTLKLCSSDVASFYWRAVVTTIHSLPDNTLNTINTP